MSHTITAEELKLWSEEPAAKPDRARIRARIGGLHCSLCTGTIERALGRLPGVEKVAVSLTHEQALVEYDPRRIGPQAVLQTLRDIGYTIHDPRKLRALGFGAMLLLAFGLGRAFPIILGACAVGWLESLKPLGAHQKAFEIAGGAILIASGLYMLNAYWIIVPSLAV